VARNDVCSVVREVAVDVNSGVVYADHHEWRLLKESVPAGMRFACYTYYCIFCLKLETEKA